ncbi:hypothetical protein HBH70_189750 [Parastagonospora nodorum]|nr:hypothetical protein HBH53_110630 [Parastagonospora nodorum]KAH3960139.1 hypothetical protein HBH51_194470 [Parastagonospora nodorum]KAH4031298.1 hypothetical protein HBI09_123000 [Parastagonospora nodorum]KAH4047885.1 hypothetical protein HBH49_161650 [Parastagonospora nodorum]KAH4065406.1 hypothetical protein HBH50_165890 [Parastagonospora nodorum]
MINSSACPLVRIPQHTGSARTGEHYLTGCLHFIQFSGLRHRGITRTRVDHRRCTWSISGLDAYKSAQCLRTGRLTTAGCIHRPSYIDAVRDITATSDRSHLEVDGDMYDAPIQGSILADDLDGLIPCRISDAASTLYMNYTQPEVHVK